MNRKSSSRWSSASRGGAVDPDDDTFQQRIVIKHLDESIGSMSMSPSNRDIVLGSRSGLYIVDLQYPWDVPRFLPGLSTWEVADVQWNVHPSRARWIVSTSGHQALVWNLEMKPSTFTRNSSIQLILTGHRRSVTDINWSVFAEDQLATCGLDGWVHTWDLRNHKRPMRSYSGWRMGATQVKWNRQDPHLLASAHDGQVLVWDDRNGSVPLHTINAHNTKIYGLDWSRKTANDLITCSLDHTIKDWDLRDLSKPDMVTQTESPIWRARYTPFGRSVLSLPQRSETALTLWGIDGSAVHRFEGHKSVCKEFVWRTRGGQDPSNDDRDFQLVTWGRDCELHLWPMTASTLEAAGHVKGQPIEVRMTRRNYENVSYRQSDDMLAADKASPSSTMKPAQGYSPMNKRGIGRGSTFSGSPSSADLSLPFTPGQEGTQGADQPTGASAGFVIRGPRAKNLDVSPITWMTRISTAVDSEELKGAGTDLSRIESEKYSLGEEIATAGQKHANRITFEKVQVSSRTCTVSCYGPWSSTNSMRFIRVTFNFPPRYPQIKPLRFELNSDMALKVRSALIRGLKTVASQCARRGSPALEPCLRFLLGERTEFDKTFADSDSDEEEPTSAKALLPAAKAHYNIPLPRQCGVSFGAHDQVVLFFARPPKANRGGVKESFRNASGSPAPLRAIPTPQLTASTVDQNPRKRRRVFESFGVLPIEASETNDDGSESDGVLRFSSITTAKLEQFRRDSVEAVKLVTATPNRLPFSTTIHIQQMESYQLLHSQIVDDFPVFGDPHEICLRNVATCRQKGHDFLALVWTTLAELMAPSQAGTQAGQRPLPIVYGAGSLAEKTLNEMISALRIMRDVQTLGLIACCLELRRRELLQTRRRAIIKREQAAKTSRAVVSSTPRLRTPQPASPALLGGEELVSTPWSEGSEDTRTVPLSRPAPSWSSLGAFLSSASLTLTKGGSPTNRSRQSTADAAQMSPTPSRRRRPSTSSTTTVEPSIASVKSTSTRATLPAPVVVKKAPRPPARAGISVTFGGTSVIAPEQTIPEHAPAVRKPRKIISVRLESAENEELRRLPAFLLSEYAQAELELARLAYAEMLGRWGYSIRRLEVLSLTLAASSDRTGVTETLGWQRLRDESGYDSQARVSWAHTCDHCGEELRPPAYSKCDRCSISRKREACVVCHTPINGLNRSCFTCLHSYHVECLATWQQVSPACASGCGCDCFS